MAESDDGLGLSLSLKCSGNYPPQRFPLNLLPSQPLSFAQRLQVSNNHNHAVVSHVFSCLFAHLYLNSHISIVLSCLIVNADLNSEKRHCARGTDGNRPLLTVERDDEALVSSPNSTVSSVSGKRVEREENEAEPESSSHGVSGDEDDETGEASASRKKLRLSKDQAAVLEETFKEHNTLNPKQKLALAKQLDLRPRQVEVWFQNRRARTKLKQTEVDCEYLKRCCDTLTEENRRLQKEVNELRALKLSPQFYMNMNPPTTLAMCPQCERVAVSSSSSSSSATATSSILGPSIPKGLLGSISTNHQKQNNPFLPRASIIPHRPHDTHHSCW
ncbi:homeobox-leucine zipper protein HAT4-like [Bidens hawaiensis]|uniref:homeobox-leucine zipper protein HAT4-like n=1 Tax=Bidens hawaiensis TaxID=980011 RepID=UPI00404A6216